MRYYYELPRPCMPQNDGGWEEVCAEARIEQGQTTSTHRKSLYDSIIIISGVLACREVADCREAVAALARHLLLKAPDKADFRAIASQAATRLIHLLSPVDQHQFVVFAACLSRSAKVSPYGPPFRPHRFTRAVCAFVLRGSKEADGSGVECEQGACCTLIIWSLPVSSSPPLF